VKSHLKLPAMRIAPSLLWVMIALVAAIVLSALSIGKTSGSTLKETRNATNLTEGGEVNGVRASVARAPVRASEESRVAPPERADARSVGSPLAAELNAPGGDAPHDVETLHALLKQYWHHLGRRQGLPIGNDSDLVRALTGHNPMKLVVIPRDHPAISHDGRLRDRWGTPYFIHPRGNRVFEIRSAGPDRQIFTSDDVVENPSQTAAR
jgi:hypothetical protein